MNDLEKLIQELCPDGVEYKELKSVFEMRNGYTPSKAKAEFWEGGTIPWFRMEDIRENGNILSDSAQHITPAAVKGKLFPANSIIVATSATIGEHALITVESLANQRFTYLVRRPEYEEKLDPKFVYYYCYKLDEWCLNNTNISSFPSVDMAKFAKFKIPIPPLPVQREMVQILDNFTELTEEITEKLTAELTARKKQYEYYRDTLLTFGVHRGGTFETKWRTLAEICDVRDGTHDSPKAVENGKYLITSKNVRDGKIDYTGAYFISEEDYNKINQRSKVDTWDVLFTMIGTVGEVGLVSEQPDFAIKNVGLIKTGDRLLAHFLKHYLISDTVKQYVAANKSKGTQAFLALGKLRELPIPVMQRQVMERLVNVLDNFDAICSDLNIGLPAEIEARKKQYEYYRDMLLTFAAADDIILTDRQTDRQTEHN